MGSETGSLMTACSSGESCKPSVPQRVVAERGQPSVWFKALDKVCPIDPETKAPAVKNPFLHPKPGVLLTDDMAVDRLLGKGAIFGACNVALHGMSKLLASNAGVSADDAAKEWAANLVPGITLLPSGVWV